MIEAITWLDIASGDTGWQDNCNLAPQEVESVGHMELETDTYVVLVQSIYTDDPPSYYDNIMSIPKGCIVSRKVLKDAPD